MIKLIRLIRILSLQGSATQAWLCSVLKISRATFFRLKQKALSDLGVLIDFNDEIGAYAIEDYGIINKERL